MTDEEALDLVIEGLHELFTKALSPNWNVVLNESISTDEQAVDFIIQRVKDTSNQFSHLKKVNESLNEKLNKKSKKKSKNKKVF